MMNLFKNWFGIGDDDLEPNPESSQESHQETDFDAGPEITLNPATGLIMVGGKIGLDVAGNPYGFSSDDYNRLNDDHGWNDHDSGHDHGTLDNPDCWNEARSGDDQDIWNSHDSCSWNDDNIWNDHDTWNADNSGDGYTDGSTGGFDSDPWE